MIVITVIISLHYKKLIKGPLSGLRQFLRIDENDEKYWKIMLEIFKLKALFVLEVFTFFSWLFGCVEKQFDKKAMVNFKMYDVTD